MRGSLFPASIIFVFIISASFISGQERAIPKHERDLKKLRELHKKAIEKAIEPVNQRYVLELETLLKNATAAGDLDTAILVRDEIGRYQRAPARSSFVGEWEYKENGRTYRRIILPDGKVELWRNGQRWSKGEGKFWFEGFTWRKGYNNTIEIFNDKGEKLLSWRLEGLNTVLQRDLKSKRLVKMVRGTKDWKK